MILSNRQKSQIARKGKRFWCPVCDMCIVGKWGKCKVCKYKDTRKKK